MMEPLVFIAARNKSQFVIDLVLENRACVDLKSINGVTPLICTIMGFKPNAVRTTLWIPWLPYGFCFFMDIDDASCEPERRMHAAKQEDMMLSLLHYGANANLRGNVGFLEETFLGATSWNAGRGIWPSDGEVSLSAPPLVCAAALGIDWAVRVLVEHGADCNSRAFGKSFWPRSQGSMRDDYKHLEYQGHRTEPGWQAGRLAGWLSPGICGPSRHLVDSPAFTKSRG